MKKAILFVITLIILCLFPGCGNLSPRANPKIEQKIDNEKGKIGEFENMQNSMKSEIGKLQSQAEIANSKLDKIQQGLINLQQNNDNHGIQILSGSGGIVVGSIFAVAFCLIALHYRSTSVMHEKTANILAQKIILQKNPELENSVFESVMHTNVSENMLNLINKQKNLIKIQQS